MSISRDHYEALESAPEASPLGWRLSMGLCNLLVAATILGFALFALYEAKLLELF